MNVWLISTSGRRRKLRAIIEAGGHHLQSADAVSIRTDLLDSALRAASAPEITIVLDAVSLAASDIKLAIEKIREKNAEVPLVVIVLGNHRQGAVDALALTGPFSVLFDEAEGFDLELAKSIEMPQSLVVDETPKKKRFSFFRKKGAGTEHAAKSGQQKSSSGENESQKANDDADAPSAPPARPPVGRRVLYALADNARAIGLSIVLTIAASIIYYAIKEKGLTFVEIGQFFGSAIADPLKSFFK